MSASVEDSSFNILLINWCAHITWYRNSTFLQCLQHLLHFPPLLLLSLGARRAASHTGFLPLPGWVCPFLNLFSQRHHQHRLGLSCALHWDHQGLTVSDTGQPRLCSEKPLRTDTQHGNIHQYNAHRSNRPELWLLSQKTMTWDSSVWHYTDAWGSSDANYQCSLINCRKHESQISTDWNDNGPHLSALIKLAIIISKY